MAFFHVRSGVRRQLHNHTDDVAIFVIDREYQDKEEIQNSVVKGKRKRNGLTLMVREIWLQFSFSLKLLVES